MRYIDNCQAPRSTYNYNYNLTKVADNIISWATTTTTTTHPLTFNYEGGYN